MKTITKQVSQTFYVCEGCGKESRYYSSDCLECKLQQQTVCSHEWNYSLEAFWEEQTRAVRECSKCRKSEERLLKDLTPAQAKLVWEMLEGE
jgi:protein-arginine kinase activator protein McsA